MVKEYFAKKDSQGRIELIDGLRGLAVCLMVCHHLLFDFVEFLGAPKWLYVNPVFNVLHYLFAGLFIILAGVSSRYSHSNLLRGLKVLAAALIITLVTWFMDIIIVFGILHFMSFAMIFYALTEKFWNKIPEAIAPIIYVVFTVISIITLKKLYGVSTHLWALGVLYPGFFSGDYFPILPWIFIFLFGTWLGGIIKAHRMPEWFYTVKMPGFAWIGRRAFIIYLVHQPVLYGFVMMIGLFI